jgi:hypothetical protein
MKLRSLIVTALSLAGLGASAAPASACWLWDKCFGNKCGINRYSTVVVCRPYNAFTPVCAGSLVCDGCCPFSCPQLPAGANCRPLLGNPMLSMCYDPAGMAGLGGIGPVVPPYAVAHGPYYPHHGVHHPHHGGYHPHPGAYFGGSGPQFTPGGAEFSDPAQQFQAPAPTPVPPGSQTRAPMGYTVQPANYYPGYYPAYSPISSGAPASQPAPAYWYGY